MGGGGRGREEAHEIDKTVVAVGRRVCMYA